MEFINFILEKHPYKKTKDDEGNVNFKQYSIELAFYLLKKYHPDNYQITGDKETKFQYCIAHEITKKLNNLYITPFNDSVILFFIDIISLLVFIISFFSSFNKFICFS